MKVSVVTVCRHANSIDRAYHTSDENRSTVIEVTDFKKAYGDTLAVTGLSFLVEPGQVWGLVGHNGAGKTTTMRAISGLLPASSGTLRVNGFDVAQEPMEAKRHLAYMPDDPQLFETLTIAEHVKFIASAYRLQDYEQEARELLEYFELLPKINTTAEELSRGMRQKLAISCGYLHKPSAILFDEPFTGLDPLAIRRLKSSIRERSAQGAAIIVSSHLLAMVEDLCTHFLMLSQGQPTFSGTRQQLQDQHGEDANLEEVFFRATKLAGDAAAACQLSKAAQRSEEREAANA